MGTFVITFDGICTHFTDNIPVPYRVVLVNATAGPTVSGIPIPPHVPSITFPDAAGNLQKVTLSGVTIAVGNAEPTSVPTLGGSIPNLSQLMAPVEVLSPRSTEYVLDGIPQWVACYFDISSGTLEVVQNNGAFAVQATIVTTSAPQLTLTPFNGATLPEGLTPTMTFGTDPVQITISNLASPAEETQSGAHFLLHYLTASQMPNAPQVPQMLQITTATVGGDCSNSVYP